MPVTRRNFLKRGAGATAAATLLFGFPQLSGAADGKPSAWERDALRYMKATGSYGVVIAVPQDRMLSDFLRVSIQGLIDTKDYAAREHLVEAVYLLRPDAGEIKGEVKRQHNTTLLGPDGKRLDAGNVVYGSPETFVEGIAPLLRGNHRLGNAAKKQRTDGVAQALRRLAREDEAEHEGGREYLVEHFPKCRAAVIQARVDAKDEAHAKRLRGVVGHWFDKLAGTKDETGAAVLPYGVKWTRSPEDGHIHCPPCGRGFVQPASRGYLRYLAEGGSKKR